MEGSDIIIRCVTMHTHTHTQAQEKSRELQQILEEKEAELVQLDQEIATSISSLKHVCSSFPRTSLS